MTNILMCIDGFIIVAFVMLAFFKKFAPKGVSSKKNAVIFFVAVLLGVLFGAIYYVGGVTLNVKGFELYNVITFTFYVAPLFLIQPLIKLYKNI